MYVSELAAGDAVAYSVKPGRQVYLLDMEGGLTCAGEHGVETMAKHDGAEVTGPNALTITAGDAGAHFLIVEMAAA